MFNQQQIALALSTIESVAKIEHHRDNDDFETGKCYDPSETGNFDDTFEEGLYSGRIDFARQLMAILTSDT